jgi:uncharacterized protein (DUF433 family)
LYIVGSSGTGVRIADSTHTTTGLRPSDLKTGSADPETTVLIGRILGGVSAGCMIEKEGVVMPWEPIAYKDYRWIVADPQLLGGSLAIRGTRLSVSLILECLSNGMSLDDIDSAFNRVFPHEALPEVLKVAAELADSIHVAA